MKNPILFTLVFFIFFSCGNKSTIVYEQIVRAPIPAKDVPFNEFAADADSAVSITTETGSFIKFDPSSFETMKGASVRGKILFKVREFHNADELFRSGIPMSTDEGRNNFLQSAGMIEVRAFQEGQELKLKSGKEGYIELAGFRSSDGYQLYQLGDDVRWRVTDSFRQSVNERKRNRLKELEGMMVEASDDAFEIAADLSEVPNLKPYKGLTWRPVSVVSKGSLDLQTAARMSWDSVKVYPADKKAKNFRLVFIKHLYGTEKDTRKEWSIIARPSLNGRSMDAILKEDARIQQLIEEEKQRMAKQAEMVNAFRINQMGIWNVDKIMKLENTINVAVSFDFASTLDADIQKVVVYMLFDDDNSVITLLPKDWKNVVIPQNKQIRFVAMLPGGKAVICDSIEVLSALRAGSGVLKLKTRPVGDKDLI